MTPLSLREPPHAPQGPEERVVTALFVLGGVTAAVSAIGCLVLLWSAFTDLATNWTLAAVGLASLLAGGWVTAVLVAAGFVLRVLCQIRDR